MVDYSIISEIGDRTINEDNIAFWQEGELFCIALADGLGGHCGGDLASSLVVKNVLKIFRSKQEVSLECMVQCFEVSKSALLAQQISEHNKYEMKTTLSILMVDQSHILWGHVGDSRIYHFYQKKFVEHTLDHSVPQMLVLAGEIREQDIRRHPDRNRLLKVMGTEWQKPAYTISTLCSVKENTAFLLCSDGFWEWITEREMEKSLKKASDAQSWLTNMKKIVEKKGKKHNMDNYSAAAVLI